MATYYVNNVTGNNANPGTAGSPFKTIAYAVTRGNNNTVKVLYTGTDYNTVNQTFPISPRSGTTITRWGAADGGVDTNPDIVADGWVSDFILLVYASSLGSIKIEYLNFDSGDFSNENGIRKWEGTAFSNLEIANCRFENIRGAGIIIEFNSSDTGSRIINIHDNYFEPFYTTLTGTIYTWSVTVPVASTAGFGASGTNAITSNASNEDVFSYTGKTGITFTGVTNISDTHYADEIVYPSGIVTPQGIYIKSATVGDGNAYGVDLAGSQIKSNIFENFKQKWASGIKISDVDANGTGVGDGFVIDSNEFRNNWWAIPMGAWAYGWTGAELKGHWTIVNNLIYGGGNGHNQRVGIWIEPWSNTEGKFYILNNDVYGKTNGIFLARTISGHQIWNNTFQGSSGYDIYLYGWQGWGVSAIDLNQIKNNQFRSGSGTRHWVVKEWGNYPTYNAILYTDGEIFNASTVKNNSTDPLYINATNNNFRKDSGSPCIDTALDTIYNYDIEDNPRAPGYYDRGAYEKTFNTGTQLGSSISIESNIRVVTLSSRIHIISISAFPELPSVINIESLVQSIVLYSQIYLVAGMTTTLISSIEITASGVIIENCSDIKIQNCILNGSGGYGVELTNTSSDVILANNTMVGVFNDAAIRFDANNTSIQNNVISLESTDYGIVKSGSPTGEKIDHNDVYNVTSEEYYDITGSAPFVPNPGTGDITDNPRFIDPINEDYSLRPDSPCINAGTSDNAPDKDIRGVTRPQ